MRNIPSADGRRLHWHAVQRVVACSGAVAAVLLKTKTRGPDRLASLGSSRKSNAADHAVWGKSPCCGVEPSGRDSGKKRRMRGLSGDPPKASCVSRRNLTRCRAHTLGRETIL